MIAGPGIPQPDFFIVAVRTKRQTGDRSCVRKDHPQLLPRFGVPHAHRLVLRAGCKHVPVRAKRNTTDFMSMPDESIPLFDRFGIPNLRLIAARTSKRRAIWTEFDVNDIRPMPEGRVFLFARFGIPQPHRPVLTSAGKQTAVRTVCHAQHLSRMFGEQIDLLKRRRIIQPNPDRTCDGKPSAVRRIRQILHRASSDAHLGALGQTPMHVLLRNAVDRKQSQ